MCVCVFICYLLVWAFCNKAIKIIISFSHPNSCFCVLKKERKRDRAKDGNESYENKRHKST